MISERTKAALAAAKRRGVKLGGFRAGAKLTAKARQAGYASRAAVADAKAASPSYARPALRPSQASRHSTNAAFPPRAARAHGKRCRLAGCWRGLALNRQ